jgi:hypothetical protein
MKPEKAPHCGAFLWMEICWQLAVGSWQLAVNNFAVEAALCKCR